MGTPRTPQPVVEAVPALRRALPPLNWVAGLHLVLLVPALAGAEGLLVSGLGVAVVQPITAVLLWVAGTRVRGSHHPQAGRAVRATVLAYVAAWGVGLLTGLLKVHSDPLVGAFIAIAVTGPVMVGAVFLALSALLARLTGARRAWWVAVPPLLAIVVVVGALIAAKLPYWNTVGDWGYYVWVIVPQLGLAASAALLSVRAGQAPFELDLRAAVKEVPGTELLLDRLPIGVRVRVPCPVPHGLQRAQDDATPLGDPVLDHTLALYTDDPGAVRELLHDHESTLLQVLHPWPRAGLESDAVLWQADVEQLAAAAQAQGHSIRAELQAQVDNARALAGLLGWDRLETGGPHVSASDGVHDD